MNLPQMWPGLSNEGLRKPSGNVLFVNVSVVDSVARPFLLVNATSRHVHGQFRVTNAQHDCNASLAERCDGCGAPASLKERDIAVSFTCKHDDDVMAAATMLLMPVLVAQRAAASQVTFSALTNLGDFWGGYHSTINGVVEVCPRSPPNLLPFSDDVLLCSANGTMLITKDGGRSWQRSGLSEELTPSIPPPPWRQRLGEPGQKTTAKTVWVDINPVNVSLAIIHVRIYICSVLFLAWQSRPHQPMGAGLPVRLPGQAGLLDGHATAGDHGARQPHVLRLGARRQNEAASRLLLQGARRAHQRLVWPSLLRL